MSGTIRNKMSPNGIPMMVMQATMPSIRAISADTSPPSTNQITLPMQPGAVALVWTTSEPKGHST